ncbi:DMT family transporter [Pacificibacter marinus]|uniref:EamA-like transporter family protein n=1 Tax=Pacificibacter marinus TaxID=658057 RepID=A0A1Y5S578_9RHOB|nr:DMT family transporter [Pacificibacter marinus]SEL38251.1 S-adenosylmethionine uptake transporter [Pacificibacter marinus]SLN32626.1 EamA-like transporter family protein [Pacificibacter marinus]
MGHLSENTRGAILMMLAMAAFSINDAILKALVSHINLYQVIFLRGCLTLILIFTVLTRITGPVSFKMPPKDAILIGIRSLSEVGASIGIVTALSLMPFANVNAVLQSAPLLITLCAALAFKQPIGWRRLAAISIGFCGVLLIARPGPEGFSDGILWGFLGVICVTIRDLSVRAMSRAVPKTTVTFGATFMTTVVMGILMLGSEWQPLLVSDIIWLVINACVITAAFALAVIVMQTGEISFVAPYRYTALVWAILIGFFVFGEWPDLWTFVGAGIIVATGIYTLVRESRLRRRSLVS